MPRALDPDFVVNYARSPSKTTETRAISLHQNVRDVLGDADYLTFLQGSYKNDTALAEMNDVDIVVVSRAIKSSFWGDYKWDKIFKDVERRLDADTRYHGKWKRYDKCITLNTSVNIDIVPAIFVEAPEKDPIKIYSFSAASEKKNWPRIHYDNAAAKSASTNGNFKQAVRLFKRWAKCHFQGTKVAPSYYIECLIYSLPNHLFRGDLAADFVSLGREIGRIYGGFFGSSTLSRIGGEGNLLTSSEWSDERFRQFRSTLEGALQHAEHALTESDPIRAKAAWRHAFAGYDS